MSPMWFASGSHTPVNPMRHPPGRLQPLPGHPRVPAEFGQMPPMPPGRPVFRKSPHVDGLPFHPTKRAPIPGAPAPPPAIGHMLRPPHQRMAQPPLPPPHGPLRAAPAPPPGAFVECPPHATPMLRPGLPPHFPPQMRRHMPFGPQGPSPRRSPPTLRVPSGPVRVPRTILGGPPRPPMSLHDRHMPPMAVPSRPPMGHPDPASRSIPPQRQQVPVPPPASAASKPSDLPTAPQPSSVPSSPPMVTPAPSMPSPVSEHTESTASPLREIQMDNVKAPSMPLLPENLDAEENVPPKPPTPRAPNDSSRMEDAASILLGLAASITEAEKEEDEMETEETTKDDEPATPGKEPRAFPSRLGLPEDEQKLNSMHCFLRSELLELFMVERKDSNPTDDRCSNAGTPTLLTEGTATVSKSPEECLSGRVGLRCVHCHHARTKLGSLECEAPMAVFYPKSISELYRLVTSWQRVHLRKCRNIPKSARDTYNKLKESDKTRGKTKYWLSSAEKIGLMDCPSKVGGIRFAAY